MAIGTIDTEADLERFVRQLGDTEWGETISSVDSRLQQIEHDGLPPVGKVGGVLADELPNPTFAVDMATQAELNEEAAVLLGKIATEQGAREAAVAAEVTLREAADKAEKEAREAADAERVRGPAGAVKNNWLAAWDGVSGRLLKEANKIIAEQIEAETITANLIQAHTITAGQIKAETITASEIAAEAITSAKLASGSVTTGTLASGAVTAGKISVSELSALTGNLGTITSGTVTGATLRTAASGKRVVLDSAGLRAYNALEATVLNFSIETGNLSLKGKVEEGSEVPAATVTGQLTNAQLKEIEAAKISGTIVESQIGAEAVGAGKIKSEAVEAAKIKTGAVTETKVGSEAITAAKIAANAIEAGKIKAEAVTAGKIATGAVEAVKIAAEAVETGKLKAEAVTAGKIAAEAIEAAKIKAGAITTGKLAAEAVTTEKIAALNITTALLAAESITAGKIAADAVESKHIKGETIVAGDIAASTITATQIAAETITGAKIAAGTITAAKLSVTTLSAITADLGTITAGTIEGATFKTTGGEFTADAEGVRLSLNDKGLESAKRRVTFVRSDNSKNAGFLGGTRFAGGNNLIWKVESQDQAKYAALLLQSYNKAEELAGISSLVVELTTGEGGVIRTIHNAKDESTYLQLLSGLAKRKVTWGTAKVKWPGGAEQSEAKKITHELGVTPVLVMAQENAFNVAAACYCGNVGEKTFEVLAKCWNEKPAAGFEMSINWIAIG